MLYIKVDAGNIIKYPYSVAELRKENPNTSFPSEMSDEALAGLGVFPVTMVPRPSADSTKNIVEGTPKVINEVWTQTWAVTDATPEEIQARKDAFNQQQKDARSSAYAVEADPIFFKAQREEATQQEWLDKIAEIKARYPYQE